MLQNRQILNQVNLVTGAVCRGWGIIYKHFRSLEPRNKHGLDAKIPRQRGRGFGVRDYMICKA